MDFYEGRTVEEIVICHDPSRYGIKWYASVRFQPVEERVYRNAHSPLEIKLKDPRLTKALPEIIKQLEKRKISTTKLNIKYFEKAA